MQFEMHLEPADITAGQLFLRRSLDQTPVWWYVLGCVGLGTLFVFGRRALEFDFHYLSAGLTVGLVGLLWLAFSIRARRVLVPSERGVVLGPHQVTTDDQGIRFASRHADVLYRWPTVRGWSAQGERIFISVDRLAVLVIPARCFESGDQKSDFLCELQRHAAQQGGVADTQQRGPNPG